MYLKNLKGHLHMTKQSYQIIINKKSLYLSSPEPFFNENYGSSSGSSKIWRLHGSRLRLRNTILGYLIYIPCFPLEAMGKSTSLKTRMTTSISSEAQNFVDGTDGHCCFLQTTGNLILISLTEKNLKIGL